MNLALRLFGGEDVSMEDRRKPDILNYELDVRIEVKGCSIINRVQIFQDQLERHREETFPVSNCVYAIFLYHNDRRRTVSRQVGGDQELTWYLHRYTRDLYIIDADALQRIAPQIPVEGRRRSLPETMMSLRTRMLRLLHRNPREFRDRFGLKVKDFKISRCRVRVSGIEFSVAVLAPRSVVRRIRRALAPHAVVP